MAEGLPDKPDDVVLIIEEVANLFGVSVTSVGSWARNTPTWIGAFRTPGGHWRFHRREVLAALRGEKGIRPKWEIDGIPE